MVWSEEFEGNSIDRSTWRFETGPTNDNVHFYTDRKENAHLEDGLLRIIALKEPYQQHAYTSAHIRTEYAFSWRYGRAEARIRLPGSPGFVPAFWMLPADHAYGWWPNSGEIDVMEYPTTEGSTIYGTVHTGYYNLFDGTQPPRGGTIQVADAESSFHLYAIEWSPEKIDFYVDDQKYYTFENDQGSEATWPFDQPFYLILNLAVGGGWVGSPDSTTVFPAVMEVDHVRVYQQPGDVHIQGPGSVTYHTRDVTYWVPDLEGTSYHWTVPGDAVITAGKNSHRITVNWGVFGGEVRVEMNTGDGLLDLCMPVRVSPNMISNMGFENGVKHWQHATGFPAKAQFTLDETGFSGVRSIRTEVTDPGGNPWDVQLSQRGIQLQAGTGYHASLAVKGLESPGLITASVIDLADYSVAGQKSFIPGDSWAIQEFRFTPARSMTAAFNVDMGGQTGVYALDDFALTTEELAGMNLVRNGDFFDGSLGWNLTSLSGASAEARAENGALDITISNGGSNPWDLHVGQAGLVVENGFEYLVSFDAKAGSQRQITPLVGMDREPWTVYSAQDPVTVDTAFRNYSFAFTMQEPTDLQARLGFDVGEDTTGIRLDNVLFRKTGAAGNVSYGTGSAGDVFSSLGHYPQPVRGETRFHFHLLQPARVSITIFSINGQQLETIGGNRMQQGPQSLIWSADRLPGGIYFYLFKAGARSEVRKLILMD